MKGHERPAKSDAVWISADGSRRFYTRQRRRWGLSGVTWTFALIGLAGPAVEFHLYDDKRYVVPLIVTALAAAAWVTYALFRSGILIEPGLLTNRRMLWTNHVPARDIVRFEPPPPNGALRRTGLRIVLVDGRILSATAFTKGRGDSESVGVAECAELNAWLETQRGAQVAPPLH